MVKQWFVSFERVRGKDVSVKIRKVIPLIIAMGMSVTSTFARAETVVGSLPILPQYPTERVTRAEETLALKVGDQVLFKVQGVDASGVQILSQVHSDDKQESLEDQGWMITDAKPVLSDWMITVVPLKAGKRVFPSLAIQNSAGQAVGRTTPVELEISTAINPADPKPNEPEEAQPPAGLQFPVWIVILGTLLGVLCLVLLGYSLYRGLKERARRRKKPEKALSEDEVALLELLKVSELGLLEKGEFKRYYFRISEVLKNYVGARYQFDALESTTGEMIEILRSPDKAMKVEGGDSVISSLSFLFESLDWVKFTDHVPATTESSYILERAREFVVNTRRTPLILNSSGVGNHADK